MADRIEIGFKEGIRDALGDKVARRINEHLQIAVDRVRTIEVHTIDGDLTHEELERAARGPLSDPIIQDYEINKGLADRFDWLIEVGFRPGVTDNVGKTAREAIDLLLGASSGRLQGVYTSRQYVIDGPISRHDAENIATSLLANELIERYDIIDGRSWGRQKGVSPYVPKVVGENRLIVEEINLDVSDENLLRISNDRVLALNINEMKALRDYLLDEQFLAAREKVGLGGKMTDAELECLAQTWSEHCKHKIFNAQIVYEDEHGASEKVDSLFDTYIKGSTKVIRERMGKDDWCLSVFVDNAGIIRFNDEYNLVFKVETHNSPSALDPYGGALTGIVGVNRDPFGTGKGAKLIFNTDVFCFAPPTYDKPLPKRILHPRRIYEGVRKVSSMGATKAAFPR